jgi:hypothetical protein
VFSNLSCDQVLIAKSEDEFQEAANALNKIANNVRWKFQKHRKITVATRGNNCKRKI